MESYSIRNILNVNIPSPELSLVSDKLEKTDFLKDGKPLAFNSYAIYSLAYFLYHEIGHIVHDNYIDECWQKTREKAADYFAFEAIKNMNEIDENKRLVGAIIGICQILFNRNPQEEEDDKDHSHSIERLFFLLDFWNIPDDSNYWKLAYKFICIWFEENNFRVTWERKTSKSFKDRFIDAYVYFRKSSQ